MFNLEPPKDDGLLIPEVGEWSKDKHFFLMHYVNAFTTAMKGKQWSGLHYIDLFAGAGIERLKTSKKLDWGSPLIAAQVRYQFTRLHLCERDKEKFNALQSRIKRYRPDTQLLNGDSNKKIYDILEEIPARSLSVAFLDPYGLHLDFKTLKALAQKRVDLILFFPDHLDVLRNWETYYWDNLSSPLDTCLGKGANWREILEQCPRDQIVEKLRYLYEQQLRTLGYTEFEYERISRNDGHPLYRLIFCAQHTVASKIWRGISRKKPDGQRTFDFGDNE